MNIREIAQISLLLAIGFILRMLVPAYGAGMKPDLLLAMLFIIIIMKRDFKTSMVAGAVAGIICALTTQFPAGQIPNIIDKLVTSAFIFLLVKIIGDRIPSSIATGIIGAVGTAFSGAIFLLIALALVGIPAPFGILYTTVVAPTIILNTIGIVILYPIVTFSQKVVNNVKPVKVTK